jgi:hypothetical protein
VSEFEFSTVMDYFKLSPENRYVARQSARAYPRAAARCYHAIFCSLLTKTKHLELPHGAWSDKKKGG